MQQETTQPAAQTRPMLAMALSAKPHYFDVTADCSQKAAIISEDVIPGFPGVQRRLRALDIRAVSDFSGVSTRRLQEELGDNQLVAVVTALDNMGGIVLRKHR